MAGTQAAKPVLPVILMGPPGSGKGTQAKLLASGNPAIRHVSTGDLFRKEIGSGSALGLKLKEILDAGQLVPDQRTNEVFESQIRKLLEDPSLQVLILDGYPRTASQAAFLLNLSHKNDRLTDPKVVELVVDEDELVSRLSGRLVNPRTGRVYHTSSNPPLRAGVCDEDGGALVSRPDDQPETVRKRFRIYSEQRDGIVKALGGEGVLKRLDGVGELASIQKRLEGFIQSSLRS
jgi:adenylate kinase